MTEESLAQAIKRLDKKLKDCLNDPNLPDKINEYQKKYGTIPEENLIKRFTI